MGVWSERRARPYLRMISPVPPIGAYCVLELCGKWLAYRFGLRSGWVWLYCSPMDAVSAPELLLNARDGPEGWRRLCVIVRLLEREEVKSLERPIELGGGRGPNGFVIWLERHPLPHGKAPYAVKVSRNLALWPPRRVRIADRQSATPVFAELGPRQPSRASGRLLGHLAFSEDFDSGGRSVL